MVHYLNGCPVCGCGIMDRIQMARDRDSWRALVTAIMNSPFSYIAGNFLITENILASLERLCLMEYYRVNYIRGHTDFHKAFISFVFSVYSSGRTFSITRPPIGGFERKKFQLSNI
jgi:hypothetical protein